MRIRQGVISCLIHLWLQIYCGLFLGFSHHFREHIHIPGFHVRDILTEFDKVDRILAGDLFRVESALTTSHPMKCSGKGQVVHFNLNSPRSVFHDLGRQDKRRVPLLSLHWPRVRIS